MKQPSSAPSVRPASSKTRVALLIATALVLAIYLGLISAGHWTFWPKTSDYYDQLASSFQHGQLDLLTKPDPALLALPNPYDPAERTNIPYVMDASLYSGRYYLYFGPFPAVLLAIFKYFSRTPIGDPALVLAFAAGVFALQSYLLVKIRRRFFAGLPGWMEAIAILVAGLIGPFTRMLVHPFIYEAALAGGQFFFMAGLTSAYLAFEEGNANEHWLWLCGGLWAGAVATRITELIPVTFMVVLLLIAISTDALRTKVLAASVRRVCALIIPLAVGGVALAWYNYARFNSIFEFGLYYQLAYNLQSFYHTLFLRGYIPQNVYNYFLNPFLVSGAFPYLVPLNGNKSPLFSFYNLPKPYVVDGLITGLVISGPVIMFAVVPLVSLIARWISRKKLPTSGEDGVLAGISAGLAGSFVAAAIPLMAFFYAATRYEADFMPCLTMLAVVGFWEADDWAGRSPALQKSVRAAGTLLAIVSVLLNTVIAFASHLTWFGIS